jgi:hypothetical protein
MGNPLYLQHHWYSLCAHVEEKSWARITGRKRVSIWSQACNRLDSLQ